MSSQCIKSEMEECLRAGKAGLLNHEMGERPLFEVIQPAFLGGEEEQSTVRSTVEISVLGKMLLNEAYDIPLFVEPFDVGIENNAPKGLFERIILTILQSFL